MSLLAKMRRPGRLARTMSRVVVIAFARGCASEVPAASATDASVEDTAVDITAVDVTRSDITGADIIGVDAASADVTGADAVAATDAGITLRFVGQDDNVTDFRTTGRPRAFDRGADGVYGSVGYVLFAMRTRAVGNIQVFGPGDPVTFADLGFETLSSLPTGIQAQSNGMDTVSAGFTYPTIDDPRAAPGPSVENIESGLGLNNLVDVGAEAPLLDLVVETGAPPTFRLGVMARGRGEDAMLRLRLSHPSGASAEGARSGTPETFMHFFDILGARAGDRFTLSMTKDTQGTNPNVALLGVTLD